MDTRWFGIAVALALLAGLFFRFYNLDRKVFWDDEIYSALRVQGYTEALLVERAAEFKTAGDLRAVLHSPRVPSARGALDTIAGLATEEPQHAPLFYLLERLWTHVFGSSLFSMRFLPAILGALALPAMYWLCLELFDSGRAAWLGAAFVAISPVQVLYSQEFREYSLWTVAILVMSALFLRAVRLMTPLAWGWFAATLTFCLYVSPLSAPIAGGYGIYVGLATTAPRRRRAFLPVLAYAIAFALFAPWLLQIAGHLHQIDRGTELGVGPRIMLAQTARTFVAMFKFDFLDLNILNSASRNVLLAAPAAIFVLGALYVTWRFASTNVRGFIVTLMAANVLPVLALYLFSSAVTLSPVRFLLPFFLAVDLTLVVLFRTMIDGVGVSPARRRFWAAALVIVVGAKLTQCALSSQAVTWWNTLEQNSISIAQTVDRSQRPLLVDAGYLVYALALSEYLKPDVPVALFPSCYLCAGAPNREPGLASLHPQRFSDVFLLDPRRDLRRQVQAATRSDSNHPHYLCIDVFHSCASSLRLFL
ncbi:MAG: glycosyltransferase family 39 protein [Vulcanimicrobiaceae bacterium]